MKPSSRLLTLLFTASTAATLHAATFITPTSTTTPYLQFSDSPFSGLDFSGGYFHLENFEDDALNTPGVTATGGSVIGIEDFGSLVDSVDVDDGVIDGLSTTGNLGRSYFGRAFTFNFSMTILGNLPTSVGIVWTDGSALVSLEAFDQNGISLGSATGVAHSDGSFSGTTGDDRFYGVTHPSGILRIILSSGTQEADHLQYGFSPIPEPSSALLVLSGSVLFLRRRPARTNKHRQCAH